MSQSALSGIDIAWITAFGIGKAVGKFAGQRQQQETTYELPTQPPKPTGGKK